MNGTAQDFIRLKRDFLKRMQGVFLVVCFLIVLVFGSMFKNTGELHVVEVALFIDWRFSEELVDFFICESIAHSGQKFSQIVLLNEAYRERESNDRLKRKVCKCDFLFSVILIF